MRKFTPVEVGNRFAVLSEDDSFRPLADEYRTPDKAIKAVMGTVEVTINKDTIIYDPSCGSEHWTIGGEVADRYGMGNTCYLDDIRPNTHWGITGSDFLQSTEVPGNNPQNTLLITNPPYGGLLERFLLKARELHIRWTCLLIPNNWLFATGKGRGAIIGPRQKHLVHVDYMLGRLAFGLSDEAARQRIAFNSLNKGDWVKEARLLNPKMTWDEASKLIPDFPEEFEGRGAFKPYHIEWKAREQIWIPGTPAGGYVWALWDTQSNTSVFTAQMHAVEDTDLIDE